MTNLDTQELTREVIERFSDTPDPRLRAVLSSLVKHLHAFAVDVQLTQEEWLAGINFLTATGQKCNPTRQEFILLSDVLGLSMLIVGLQAKQPAGVTEATVFGPFFVPDAPELQHGDDVAQGAPGRPCRVSGSVRGVTGEPIRGAVIDVWQADDEGFYDVQKPDLTKAQARGRLRSRDDGSFEFRSIVAEAYPIPTDGPVGSLLEATKRSPWRPAHLHFMIQAEGYATLITHVFKKGDSYLGADPVFGVRPSLVADWVPQADGTTLLHHDFVLAPAQSRPAV